MADPVLIVCNKDAWTKVATAVRNGNIHIDKSTVSYLQTYRDTGGAAPSGRDEGVRIPIGGAAIASKNDIDVYIYAQKEDGKVRVDL